MTETHEQVEKPHHCVFIKLIVFLIESQDPGCFHHGENLRDASLELDVSVFELSLVALLIFGE